MALDAYPEAYVEFKQLLLLLVCPEGKSTGGGPSSLWSPAARQELSDEVYYTVLASQGGV